MPGLPHDLCATFPRADERNHLDARDGACRCAGALHTLRDNLRTEATMNVICDDSKTTPFIIVDADDQSSLTLAQAVQAVQASQEILLVSRNMQEQS